MDLKDLIEIRKMTLRATVTRIQSSPGDFPKSVSKSLLHVVAPGISFCGWGPNIEEGENDGDGSEYRTTRPFIKF